MSYIIDPKLVYWISVASAVKTFIIVIAVIILVISGVILLAVGIYVDYYEEDEIESNIKKTLKIIILCISFIFISLFIPSKETAIEMIIASKVTTESIQATKEEIYDLIDYTVEKINGNDEEK